MKKNIVLVLVLVFAGFAVGSCADIVANLLSDEGFESITGNEPNAGTAPWFTSGEGSDASFISSTDQAHSGLQSAKFTFNFDDGAVVQNLNTQVDTSLSYEASIWLLIDTLSVNAAHTPMRQQST